MCVCTRVAGSEWRGYLALGGLRGVDVFPLELFADNTHIFGFVVFLYLNTLHFTFHSDFCSVFGRKPITIIIILNHENCH